MDNQVHLTPNQVPAFLKGTYKGKKFQARIATQVELHDTTWDGGTRNTYYVADLYAQKLHPDNITAGSCPPQFGLCMDQQTIQLKPGFAVIEHCTFCGKDMGLRIYVNPLNAPQFLPAPAKELTFAEHVVLTVTCGLKPAYRWEEVERYRLKLPRESYDEAKAYLVHLGLLNKAGAVTVAGRNARKYRDLMAMQEDYPDRFPPRAY